MALGGPPGIEENMVGTPDATEVNDEMATRSLLDRHLNKDSAWGSVMDKCGDACWFTRNILLPATKRFSLPSRDSQQQEPISSGLETKEVFNGCRIPPLMRNRRETDPVEARASPPAAADEDLMMEDEGEMVTEALDAKVPTMVSASKDNGTKLTATGLNGRQGRRDQAERAVVDVFLLLTWRCMVLIGKQIKQLPRCGTCILIWLIIYIYLSSGANALGANACRATCINRTCDVGRDPDCPFYSAYARRGVSHGDSVVIGFIPNNNPANYLLQSAFYGTSQQFNCNITAKGLPHHNCSVLFLENNTTICPGFSLERVGNKIVIRLLNVTEDLIICTYIAGGSFFNIYQRGVFLETTPPAPSTCFNWRTAFLTAVAIVVLILVVLCVIGILKKYGLRKICSSICPRIRAAPASAPASNGVQNGVSQLSPFV